MQKRKVLLVYNETSPELYVTKSEIEHEHLNFLPYFEIENVTPMEEFDVMVNLIREAGYDVVCLNLNDNFQLLLDTLQREKPDVIFNCIEIFYGKAPLEMNLAGLFELFEIPYTGAPALTLANCQNKALTKMILRENGIPTPKFELVRLPDKEATLADFPLIVKPMAEDASVGIENGSVVRTPEALKERIRYIHDEFNQPAIVEQFIQGRELNVAVLGGEKPRVLPISEIDFSEMPDHLEKIVSYQAKWDSLHEAYHTTIPICPAELPDEVRKNVEEIALRVYKIMELRDYCRVDMRLAPNNQPYVLEANPNPDLSEGAGFMRSAEAAGYNYQDMLVRIIEMALTRRKSSAV
jgi:D-alanine-D-alanine ligase